MCVLYNEAKNQTVLLKKVFKFKIPRVEQPTLCHLWVWWKCFCNNISWISRKLNVQLAQSCIVSANKRKIVETVLLWEVSYYSRCYVFTVGKHCWNKAVELEKSRQMELDRCQPSPCKLDVLMFCCSLTHCLSKSSVSLVNDTYSRGW